MLSESIVLEFSSSSNRCISCWRWYLCRTAPNHLFQALLEKLSSPVGLGVSRRYGLLDRNGREFGWLTRRLASRNTLDEVVGVTGYEQGDGVALLARLVDDTVDVAFVFFVCPS